jgi:hydroxyacyl-ACP dehydratase HTD2-like protein with hotdog domain
VTAARAVVGEEIPPLVTTPTLRDLVRYAGASGDFYEMHYDLDAARALGHPELSVHGLLKAALLARMVTAWAGEHSRLGVLDVSYRGMDFRNAPCICRGRVNAVHGNDVRLQIWTEDARGHRTTLGHAEVQLPPERPKEAS